MLQKLDRNPDNFKQYACDMNRRKTPCFCKNKDSVKKYICYYKMYGSY